VYKHILIPTDGLALAEKAENAGLEFARTFSARVTAFTVVPKYVPPSDRELVSKATSSLLEHNAQSIRKAEAILARIVERAHAANIEINTDYAQNDRPYEAIIEAARRLRCDLIFITTHGRVGLDRLLHGSVMQDVLTRSNIPTLVYR
jgi:nucleotide-binding universal stress UspA family protein